MEGSRKTTDLLQERAAGPLVHTLRFPFSPPSLLILTFPCFTDSSVQHSRERKKKLDEAIEEWYLDTDVDQDISFDALLQVCISLFLTCCVYHMFNLLSSQSPMMISLNPDAEAVACAIVRSEVSPIVCFLLKEHLFVCDLSFLFLFHNTKTQHLQLGNLCLRRGAVQTSASSGGSSSGSSGSTATAAVNSTHNHPLNSTTAGALSGSSTSLVCPGRVAPELEPMLECKF